MAKRTIASKDKVMDHKHVRHSKWRTWVGLIALLLFLYIVLQIAIAIATKNKV